MIAGTVVALLLLAGATLAGYRWTQGQYYVGDADGAVAIYQGVEGMSHVAETAGLRLDELTDFERKRVESGIHAESIADARQIVARLRASIPTPTPSPTPSKTPTKTPSPTPKKTP